MSPLDEEWPVSAHGFTRSVIPGLFRWIGVEPSWLLFFQNDGGTVVVPSQIEPDGPEPNRQEHLLEARARFRLPERVRRCPLPAQDFHSLPPHPPLADQHFCGNRPSS